MINPTVAERIRSEIASSDVVVFMKGTPVFPQCGFSAQAVQIFSMLSVRFKSIDVLVDPSLHQGVKDYSNWPTLPQIYIKGDFIGGSDILREMLQTGELQKMLRDGGVPFDDRVLA